MKQYKSALCNFNGLTLTIETNKHNTFCMPDKLYKALMSGECKPLNTYIYSNYNGTLVDTISYPELKEKLMKAEHKTNNYGMAPSSLWIMSYVSKPQTRSAI